MHIDRQFSIQVIDELVIQDFVFDACVNVWRSASELW